MKINVMIAGAQKAGTSSLKYYLEQHPDVSSHINLECDYFTSEEENFDEYFKKYFSSPQKVVLAKQAHIYKEDKFIKKLHAHNKNVKILFILREPIERLISAYDMGRNDWIDFTPDAFVDALNANAKGDYNLVFNTLIKLGDYGRAAQLFYEYFDKEQVLFVSFDSLKNKPLETVLNAYKFIGVDEKFIPELQKKNTAYTQKYFLLRKAFSFLRQSKLNKFAKIILPYRYFFATKKFIENINRKPISEPDKTELDGNVLSLLTEYYKKTNIMFEDISGIRVKEFF
jgi:hypothetical protein